ncbi:MAG: hypothetical protein MOIL_00686 [Candidatus Methanolliviera sp. GoM_oil]|nr:MAG: hypothetical protein MOIL_00686 [Candidatus Methanolliviera sp. GoM_oil]
MMKVMVDSRICGYTTVINAKKEGKMIHIEIETICPKLSDFDDNLGDLTMGDLLCYDNKIRRMAHECKLCASCLVPCGVITAAQIEAKLMAKSLALKEKEICIKFLE